MCTIAHLVCLRSQPHNSNTIVPLIRFTFDFLGLDFQVFRSSGTGTVPYFLKTSRFQSHGSSLSIGWELLKAWVSGSLTSYRSIPSRYQASLERCGLDRTNLPCPNDDEHLINKSLIFGTRVYQCADTVITPMLAYHCVSGGRPG